MRSFDCVSVLASLLLCFQLSAEMDVEIVPATIVDKSSLKCPTTNAAPKMFIYAVDQQSSLTYEVGSRGSTVTRNAPRAVVRPVPTGIICDNIN